MLSRVARSPPVKSLVSNSKRTHYYLQPDGHPGANIPWKTQGMTTFLKRMQYFSKFVLYVSIPVWTPWIALRFHCKKASGM